MGPSSFLVASERERSVAYGKCMNVQEIMLVCHVRMAEYIGFVWWWESDSINLKGVPNYFSKFDKFIHHYMCVPGVSSCVPPGVSSSTMCLFLPQADIVGFDSVGRQSSQLWKPAAPPLKRS
jgi:hypothetical protein